MGRLENGFLRPVFPIVLDIVVVVADHTFLAMADSLDDTGPGVCGLSRQPDHGVANLDVSRTRSCLGDFNDLQLFVAFVSGPTTASSSILVSGDRPRHC